MCEMPTCYVHETPKARKAHRCCECRGTIQPGETYHSHNGVWDGEGATHKVCADCEALRQECDRHARHDDEQTAFGYLSDSAQNDPDMFSRFVNIMRKRGATVPQWVADAAGMVSP